jgi:predicted tellurium resistance membrane protein TerC
MISGKSLILIVGGLFLVGKAAYELHEKLEAAEHHAGGTARAAAASFGMVITQIVLIDIVFSLDSVITAVGMSNQIPIMITAVILAAVTMIVFARPVSNFVEKHPTLKVLALSFLLLIGVMLFVEGFEYHVPKGYIYFAMFFALAVEFLNMQLRKKAEKVRLRYSHLPEERKNAPH